MPNFLDILNKISVNGIVGQGGHLFYHDIAESVSNEMAERACGYPYGNFSIASDIIFTETKGKKCPECNLKSRERVWDLELFMKPNCLIPPDRVDPVIFEMNVMEKFIEQLLLMDWDNADLISPLSTYVPPDRSTALNKPLIQLNVDTVVPPTFVKGEKKWKAIVNFTEYYCSYT